MRWSIGGILVALALWIGAPGPAWPQPVAGQDPVAGARVFGAKGCSKCHAINGIGGTIGPDLGRAARPRSLYDVATAMWNHLPRMTDRMRQLGIVRPRLTAEEAGHLLSFLYTRSYFDPPGNPDAGRRLFAGKSCIVCHSVGGAGGVIGPPLDFARDLASPIHLAAAMWNHGPQMAEAMKARRVERPVFSAGELRDLVAYLVPPATRGEDGPVYTLPGSAERGRALFAERRCVSCHAAGGTGGQLAPDLAQRGGRRSPLEFAAAMWNKAPVMTAAMAARGIAVPQLRADEMADLVGYLYAVGYFGQGGNATHGAGVASRKGCLVCHSVRGEGGKPASALARARGVDSPVGLTAALWNHATVEPKGAGWPRLEAEEMADLAAWLGTLGPRR